MIINPEYLFYIPILTVSTVYICSYYLYKLLSNFINLAQKFCENKCWMIGYAYVRTYTYINTHYTYTYNCNIYIRIYVVTFVITIVNKNICTYVIIWYNGKS